jgi:hypothetical protein
MICETCAATADMNRRLFNDGAMAGYPHPVKCGCACQHRKPASWEKYFSVEEPDAEER